MSAYLLDVNVLVSLAWPEHSQHTLAQKWFANHSKQGWATCPLVQAGFARIVSNPAFSLRAVTVSEAVKALDASLRDPAHQFWPDSLSFPDALQLVKRGLHGHQQVTDAYLVGLAIQNRGKLATLDRGIAAIAPIGVVEVIG